ncbi:MAG: sigma-70 family RNA polymerase sigma factor [Saprospiraceae bacterium]
MNNIAEGYIRMEKAYSAGAFDNTRIIELIERCRKDERIAQEELFKLYAGKMMTLCRRYAQFDYEAEDLLQEGFIRLFKNLTSFRNEGSFDGWVRKLFVHSILKSLSSKNFHHDDHLEESIHDAVMEPLILDKISSEEIISLVNELPFGYKTVFNLAIMEGYSHKEIAELMHIEEVTSRSQLLKARKMLQKKIEASNKVLKNI